MEAFNIAGVKGDRMEVPGGWIYRMPPAFTPVYVPDPTVWGAGNDTASILAALYGLKSDNATTLAAVYGLKQEISTMSTTISQQFTDINAKLAADYEKIAAGVGAIRTELADAVSKLTAGNTVTQDQVDALVKTQTSFDALADALSTAQTGALELPGAA